MGEVIPFGSNQGCRLAGRPSGIQEPRPPPPSPPGVSSGHRHVPIRRRAKGRRPRRTLSPPESNSQREPSSPTHAQDGHGPANRDRRTVGEPKSTQCWWPRCWSRDSKLPDRVNARSRGRDKRRTLKRSCSSCGRPCSASTQDRTQFDDLEDSRSYRDRNEEDRNGGAIGQPSAILFVVEGRTIKARPALGQA